jgi:hypothetical protein
MQLNILVEGQTEETFSKEILSPYLAERGINVTPIIISTKRLRNGLKFKGGLSDSNYGSFEADLKRLIHSTPHGLVTTFIDYYALPTSFPGYEDRLNIPTQIQKVRFLEGELAKTIGDPQNFIPHIQLHEFEALLFSDMKGFEAIIDDDGQNIAGLRGIVASYGNPEDIDEGHSTAPSKRILTLHPRYEKVVEGNLIALEIGVEKFIEKCPHFREWTEKIIDYSKQ